MAGIDKYHSYQFTQQRVKAWRYYQTGELDLWYCLIHTFLSNQELFSPFSHAKMV